MAESNLISSTFDWYLMDIMPIVSQNAIQQKYGYHGLYTHTAAVVFRGIDYALNLGKSPKNVVLACAFHDMARVTDGDDTQHGANAVPMALRVMDEIGNIDIKSRDSIAYAIKNHSFNLVAPDYVSACLWDADRTRLAWELGYNSRFFATQRAKTVAAGNANQYLQFMNQNMSDYARNIITKLDKQY
ncbi:MAG: HD domain-containing protein [Alphaproteobacteria bacterium]|nr:HD domain-containing protein [Alphaproteobacteria bacterium]